MIRIIKASILLSVLILMLNSCTTRKEVVYFQDIDSSSLSKIDVSKLQPQIQANDILSINVSAIDMESTTPFIGPGVDENGAVLVRHYLVSSVGTIDYPVLGSIDVMGLTTSALKIQLEEKLAKYIIDPIVSVRLVNTKITILGAVNNPGTFQIEEEYMNMLQAIGLAGDFSINGKRENVLLIRQVNGERSIMRLDFTKTDWLNSPAFFVKQNDVLYVEPNYALVTSAGLFSDVNDFLRVLTVITTTALLFLR